MLRHGCLQHMAQGSENRHKRQRAHVSAMSIQDHCQGRFNMLWLPAQLLVGQVESDTTTNSCFTDSCSLPWAHGPDCTRCLSCAPLILSAL